MLALPGAIFRKQRGLSFPDGYAPEMAVITAERRARRSKIRAALVGSSLAFGCHCAAKVQQICWLVNSVVEIFLPPYNLSVPKKSGRMTEREQAICSRIKDFRKLLRYSQRSFAEILCITRNQLSGIEYHNAPVTYLLACTANRNTSLNPVWLATGSGVQVTEFLLPDPNLLGVGNMELFSEVFAREGKSWAFPSSLPPLAYQFGVKTFTFEQSAKGRLAALDLVVDKCADSLAAVPDIALDHFVNDVLQSMNSIAANYSKMSTEAEVKSRAKEMVRLLDEKRVKPAKQKTDTFILYNEKAEARILGMSSKEVPTWAQLKKTIAGLTAAHGQKAALADELKVSRQVLGNWLSSDNQGAPNAELTLRLFKWSLDPKRKPK